MRTRGRCSREHAQAAPHTHAVLQGAWLVSQQSTGQCTGGRRGLPAALARPSAHRALPHISTAQESAPACLSVARHCILRPGSPSAERAPEEPFSSPALGARARVDATSTKICTAGCSPHARARGSAQPARPPTAPAARAASAQGSAPSIFGARGFGRYVATRFLAGADFYGHRPAVWTRARPCGVYAPCSGALAAHGVHPPSPGLLTRHGPPGAPNHAPTTASTHRCFGVWECARCGCPTILSTPRVWWAPAVLRDISGGTSYQTVRLVFRPYAQVLPSN